MAEDTDFLVAQDVHRFVFPDLRFGGVQQRARVEVGRLRVAREEEIEQEKTERTETEVYFSVSSVCSCSILTGGHLGQDVGLELVVPNEEIGVLLGYEVGLCHNFGSFFGVLAVFEVNLPFFSVFEGFFGPVEPFHRTVKSFQRAVKWLHRAVGSLHQTGGCFPQAGGKLHRAVGPFPRAGGPSAHAVGRFSRVVEARDHADDCAAGEGDVKRGALGLRAKTRPGLGRVGECDTDNFNPIALNVGCA